MADSLRNSRIGIYECSVVEGRVIKGEYIRSDYIGVFSWDALVSRILPDLKQNNRLRGHQLPVLIASWQLLGSDPSKGTLGISRRSFPQTRRRKVPGSERWEAIIDTSWHAIRVEAERLVEEPG